MENEITSKRTDRVLQVFLARLRFLSIKEKVTLFNLVPTAEYLARLKIKEISAIIKRSLYASYNGEANLQAAKREVLIMNNKQIQYLCYLDPNYPPLLKETADAPFMLYYIGNINCLSSKKAVSVVGTRHIVPEVSKKTVEFCKEAAEDGCTVISGLAQGVDTFSHKGVLDAYYFAQENGERIAAFTCAVLPSSIDNIVPAMNKKLASSIVKAGGCLVSELSPLVHIEKWCFAKRNRIIAALSPATVVMQAPAGSGALITAKFALEYGKIVFFHKAAFSPLAKKMDEKVTEDLLTGFNQGLVSRQKLSNTIQYFIDKGCPIIDDYQTYKLALDAFTNSYNKTNKDFVNKIPLNEFNF